MSQILGSPREPRLAPGSQPLRPICIWPEDTWVPPKPGVRRTQISVLTPFSPAVTLAMHLTLPNFRFHL